jgi:hypothetical protein
LLAPLVFARADVTTDLSTPTRAAACVVIPVMEAGRAVRSVCRDDADDAGLTVLDLGDPFVPRVLRAEPGTTLAYAATYVELADQRGADAGLELFGVVPSFGALLDRLDDDERHACHEAIADGPLISFAGPLLPDDRTPRSERDRPERRAAVAVLDRHLACDGDRAEPSDRYDAATADGLAAFRRRNALLGSGPFDPVVRAALLAGSRERDLRAVLRALRERIIDATGVIEDGSAIDDEGQVLGRSLDDRALRDPERPPLPNGAADWTSPATEAAALALGWTDPAAARVGLEEIARREVRLVAIGLPALPTYHRPFMALRVEIDRGDVWPGRRGAAGGPLRPTLTVYAATGDGGEIALVRWPTTIGGWQQEKLPGGAVVWRYKPSPTGEFVWRDVVSAPVWFAPPSTPDQELTRRTRAGIEAREDTIGPGHRSAYGLVMLVHRRPGGGDTQVRTHGTVSYGSVPRGQSSHGCHRLLTRHALRLAGFLLAHRTYQTRGTLLERYERTVRRAGRRFVLRREERGYARDLEPPVSVRVLPGRVHRGRR